MSSNPRGYRLYFTDNRVIGVSYRKIVSQAFRPAFLIFIIWIVSLVSLAAFEILNAAMDSVLLGPPIGRGGCSPRLLVYLSPKHAQERTAGQTISSIWELENLTKDAVLQRGEISQVNLGRASFYDAWGGGLVTSMIITVILKTGQNVVFVSGHQGNIGIVWQVVSNLLST